MKILNPLPPKISQPSLRKGLIPPQKISQPPTKTKFSPPPPKISQPWRKFLTPPPPENFSTPLKYHNPTRENLNPKSMLTINHPPPPSFYLFSFFPTSIPSLFKENLKKILGRV